ncbi:MULTISPECIES: protein-export chaperone SecB [Bacteroides]|jgi:preprotein translocase subunit SecB|uniref:protein-export chaperone SecB n=1 Tax=Bacteroides TaxID=816 RepID=UPI0018A9B3B8|nr:MULTISPECIES: protein-export chaperone SecB [Bacteroides]MBT9922796.1 protein export chaperone secb [Bacteroides uniformis]DAV45216.1 MAG TPA: hypothetical protein [Bacteriophage sp.]
MAEQIAKFRFLRYNIIKSSIEIDDNKVVNEDLTVEFSQEGAECIENNLYKHTLGVDIMDKNNVMRIKVVVIGLFEFDRDVDEKLKSTFFNSSAPAILFPYVRAYVTTLTGLSGVNPVILPTLNLAVR